MTRFISRTWISRILIFLLNAYVGSYIILSVQGRFEPAAFGLNGVKAYIWAPRGFLSHFRWNQTLRAAYMPIYWLDTRFWHTMDDAYTDRYPVNSNPASEFGRVHQATTD